jgi:50S ribosomal protein L16 3-hydroxylase
MIFPNDGPLTTTGFLTEYWQKKPCLIRQAISGYEPLLDGNDLAGLACDEMAESRLVEGTLSRQDWTVRHGPFTESDFSALPDENWTLLVQDVEKHYAPMQALIEQFSFIPGWRLDDLMVSYAEKGGSVGPHTDQYDVFLLQAGGRRRWQIAESFQPALLEDCPLNVLKSFNAEQEWVLEPGDMLYLPPNVAHHGVALEAGMTWSIGCRAPSVADLLQGLGEWLAFTNDDGGRYADPKLKPVLRAGEINADALQDLADLMRSAIENKQDLDNYLAAFMSRFRLAHEPVPPPEQIKAGELLKALDQGSGLLRNPWTRLVWIEHSDRARLYAAGQAYECSIAMAEQLCRSAEIRFDPDLLDQQGLDVLKVLINNGHLLLSANG